MRFKGLSRLSFTFELTEVSYNLSSRCDDRLEITLQTQCNVVKTLELSDFLHFAIGNFIMTTKRVQHFRINKARSDRPSSQYN